MPFSHKKGGNTFGSLRYDYTVSKGFLLTGTLKLATHTSPKIPLLFIHYFH